MDILKYIEDLSVKLPHFSDGRIDYTNFSKPPVLNLVVTFKGRVLLLKRSKKVMAYKGKWNSLGGFLDEVKPVEDKMYMELEEELGVGRSMVSLLVLNPVVEVEDAQINRTWVLVPGLAILKEKPEIVLDFEHTEFAWVKPSDVASYDIVTGLDKLVMSFEDRI